MIKIAILGLGTVGTGVAKVVTENARQIERKLGEPLQVKTVLVRTFRDGPCRQLMTDDFKKIEDDEEIRVVVETIGGVDAAYEYTRRALSAGKHVVTANKQLVAEKGCELLALAKKKNVSYLFEASVGGGIPIIRPMNTSMTGDKVEEISGIFNGTTNFILTKMAQEGTTFDAALKEAQELGYAERDPSADVEGQDTCRKIAILTSVAYNHEVDYTDIYTEGITKITDMDVRYAKELGRSIKLLAISKKTDDKYFAIVAPFMLSPEHPMFGVNGVFNSIMVKGNVSGPLMFYGSGAGKLPTAGAVIADVIAATRNMGRGVMSIWDGTKLPVEDKGELTSRFFLRISGSRAAKEEELRKLFEIETVVELPGEDEFGVVTGPMTEKAFDGKQASLEGVLGMIRVGE